MSHIAMIAHLDSVRHICLLWPLCVVQIKAIWTWLAFLASMGFGLWYGWGGLIEYSSRTHWNLIKTYWVLIGMSWGLARDSLRTHWGLMESSLGAHWGLIEDSLRTHGEPIEDSLSTHCYSLRAHRRLIQDSRGASLRTYWVNSLMTHWLLVADFVMIRRGLVEDPMRNHSELIGDSLSTRCRLGEDSSRILWGLIGDAFRTH